MSLKKLNGTVIVTYRCNARCTMCNRYKAPSKPEDEISVETVKKLPKMYFTNITGGEPFIREDLKDIVRELFKLSDRIVISTNARAKVEGWVELDGWSWCALFAFAAAAEEQPEDEQE